MEPPGHRGEGEAPAADLLQDVLVVQGRLVLEGIEQEGKIGLHRLRRGNIVKPLDDPPGRRKVLRHCVGRFSVGLEAVDHALLKGMFVFPVAAAPRLDQRVQPRHGAIDGGKVHVHPGLHQTGGDHPADRAVLELPPDLRQHRPPVGGAHHGGQVKTALPRQPLKQLLGLFPVVDDAQDLLFRVQPLGQGLVGERAQPLIPHPAEEPVHRLRLGAQLNGGGRQTGTYFLKQWAQGWLGGGAQHGGAAVLLHQPPNGGDAGGQTVHRQHLGLVENDDAVHQVVELPAPGGAVGVEGLEKLHCGGQNDRGVPVLGGEPPGIGVPVPAVAVVHVGVMGHHVLRAEDVLKYPLGLLNDGGVRDDVDNAPLAVGHGVAQGEGHGGDRLAPAGGHRQGEQAGWPRPGVHEGPQNLAPFLVERLLRAPPWLHLSTEPVP